MSEDFVEQKTGRNRVEFYLRPKADPVATVKEGRPMVKMVEYIRISGGDLRNLPDKPAHDGHRQKYPREYAAFLANKNQDQAAGTLLSASGVVSPERVEELKYFKIYTVEQLADVPDGAMSQMGLHTRKERERAKDYMKTAQGYAPVSQLRAELEQREKETQERERLKDARIDELERRLRALLEKEETDESGAEPKRRGRPPKVDPQPNL